MWRLAYRHRSLPGGADNSSKRDLYMSSQNSNTELKRHAVAIGNWENDGGAIAQQAVDNDYARRIEFDNSWSVYHVFSGAPACVDDVVLTGLTRSSATEKMLRLNRETVLRKQRRQLRLPL